MIEKEAEEMKGNFKNPGKDYNSRHDILENAAIMAGYSFFTTLAGIKITAVITDPLTTVLAASISAGLSFFGYLVTAKGLSRRAAK